MSKILVAIVYSFLLSAANEAAHADEKLAPEVTYYLGESKMTTPDARLLRTSLSLVKRVVNKADSRIEEHVLTIGEKDAAKAFVVVMEVKGAKYTIAERSNAFTGDGELKGEAWKWKEWKSVTKLGSGMGTVTSEDKITDHGLSAKKTYAGADGKVILHFDETLERISAKTYEILYVKLAPAEKK